MFPFEVTKLCKQFTGRVYLQKVRASCRDEAIDILRDRYPIAKIKR